jgi:hypothetical protein
MPETPESMPEEYQRDLTPTFLELGNRGKQGPPPAPPTRTAYDIKSINQEFGDLPDDMLKQIPILMKDTPLEEGSKYIDLNEPNYQEFTAYGKMVAGPQNWYVAKSSVDYVVWNILTGVTNPERLDLPDQQGTS